MKKFLCLLIMVLSGAFSATAQGHSVGLSWTASPTTGIAGYNVYRAPCTGTITGTTCSAVGAFAKIGTVAAGTLAYTDSSVTGGQLLVYGVTAYCGATGCTGADPNSESVKSNLVALTIPSTPPQPPGSLSLGTVAFNHTGSNATLSASWTDGTTPTNWTLTSQGVVVARGTLTSTNGSYTLGWTGKISPKATGIVFGVCDSSNACVSKNLG